MSKIKLIASDIDGTLLLNGAQSCCPETFTLIHHLWEKGILFAAASGRQYQSLRRLFEPVKDKILYLCENGALAIYEGKVLFKETFPRDLAMELGQEILSYPGCDLLVSGEKASYAVERNPAYIRRIRHQLGNEVKVVERLEQIEEPVIKVAFYGDEEVTARAGAYLGKRFEGRCCAVVSGNTWLDFMVPGVSKGSAMKRVSSLLNIPAENMAAFGDHENDREMLEYVGHPYLVDTCSLSMRDLKGRVRFCGTVEEEVRRILKTADRGGR